MNREGSSFRVCSCARLLERIMSYQTDEITSDTKTKRAALDARLDGIGWGVLLITIGAIWLLPEKQVPHGSWLIAAGLIMLALNAIRYFNGIRMSGFNLVLGTLACIAGLGQLFGWELPLFAIALVVIGTCMLVSTLFARRPASPADQGCCCGWPENPPSSVKR